MNDLVLILLGAVVGATVLIFTLSGLCLIGILVGSICEKFKIDPEKVFMWLIVTVMLSPFFWLIGAGVAKYLGWDT